MGVGEGGRLECTAGPVAGRKFELTGDEVEIGRAVKSAIAIPDPTVSRSHLLLRKSAAGWTARDLGSGNGTVLNGERILEETPLSEGDVLALGDTQFSFYSSEQAPLVFKSKRRLFLWRATATAFLLTALALAWTKQHSARLSAAKNDEARRSREVLEAAFQSAKKLVRQGISTQRPRKHKGAHHRRQLNEGSLARSLRPPLRLQANEDLQQTGDSVPERVTNRRTLRLP